MHESLYSTCFREPGRSLNHNPESRTGCGAGGGLEFNLPFARLSPGNRFTRYGAARGWLPNAISLDFLAGLTF